MTTSVGTIPARAERVLGGERWSVSLRLRAVAVSGVLLAVCIALFCTSIAVGDFRIPLRDVVTTLLGGGDENMRLVVVDIRLPRALVGAAVGMAFGLSGGLFQSLASNPLASPDIIGISQGASLGAVAVIVLGGGDVITGVSSLGVPTAALAGAIAIALLVYVLSYRQGVQGLRLILIGIALGSVASALTSYLLIRADLTEATRATAWLTGSLKARGWEHVRPVVAGLAVFGPMALYFGRQLRYLELGDDTARGLGVRVESSRFGIVIAGVGLAALATAAAGPVAFVAFVAPVIARRLVGGGASALITCGLAGATLLLASDLVARRIIAPVDLPVGLVTAVIGAPYLFYLMWRSNRLGGR